MADVTIEVHCVRCSETRTYKGEVYERYSGITTFDLALGRDPVIFGSLCDACERAAHGGEEE